MPTPDLRSLPGARATPLPRGRPKEELPGGGLMSEPHTLQEHHAQPSLPCCGGEGQDGLSSPSIRQHPGQPLPHILTPTRACPHWEPP